MSSSTSSTPSHRSLWIFRAIVAGAALFAVGGLLLMGLSDDEQPSRTFDRQSPTLPEDTSDGQVSSADNVGYIADATPVPWSEFIPEEKRDKHLIEKVLDHFGKAARGPGNAPVTIIEFGSYGCPSCRMVHREEMVEELFERYPNKIRFVFVIWPVIHANDEMAAEASLCALDQGRRVFWDYHDALLNLTDRQFDRYTHYQRFSSLAEHVEMDTTAFNTCLVDGEHRDFAFDLVQAGINLNLRGTPTFFVNGEMTHAYHLEREVDEFLAHQN